MSRRKKFLSCFDFCGITVLNVDFTSFMKYLFISKKSYPRTVANSIFHLLYFAKTPPRIHFPSKYISFENFIITSTLEQSKMKKEIQMHSINPKRDKNITVKPPQSIFR